MVEQSMKRRGLDRAARLPFRIASYVALTCCGSGRQVTTVSCEQRQLARLAHNNFYCGGKDKTGVSLGFSEDWLCCNLKIMRKADKTPAPT